MQRPKRYNPPPSPRCIPGAPGPFGLLCLDQRIHPFSIPTCHTQNMPVPSPLRAPHPYVPPAYYLPARRSNQVAGAPIAWLGCSARSNKQTVGAFITSLEYTKRSNKMAEVVSPPPPPRAPIIWLGRMASSNKRWLGWWCPPPPPCFQTASLQVVRN